MTLHISLPKELENLVHHEVNSGMYGSASEVVREALRCLFTNSHDLTPQELSWLRDDMKKRRDRLQKGEEQWIDGEAFFAHMEEKYR